jgi:hypothetical protein
MLFHGAASRRRQVTDRILTSDSCILNSDQW